MFLTMFTQTRTTRYHAPIDRANKIRYIAQHGSIVIETLYDVPFSSISHEGIDGVFAPADVTELVAVLKPFLRGDTPPASH